jgi:hypothetical protein
MDKQREAFEKWAQINIKKEFDPIDINDCYKAWQAAIESQQDENNKLKIQIELLKQSAMASIQAIMDSQSK